MTSGETAASSGDTSRVSDVGHLLRATGDRVCVSCSALQLGVTDSPPQLSVLRTRERAAPSGLWYLRASFLMPFSAGCFLFLVCG